MLPFLLAIAGGYLIGNSMKDETPKFDKGGVVKNPDELYKELGEAEMNYSKDDGASYHRIMKEISENRKLYFKRLGESEMNWHKDNGAEYSRLISMRDKFDEGGDVDDDDDFWNDNSKYDLVDESSEDTIRGNLTLAEAERLKGEYLKANPNRKLRIYSTEYADGGMMAKGGQFIKIKGNKKVGMSSDFEKMVKDREVLVMSVRSKIASLVGLDEALRQLQKDWVVSPYNLIQSAISKGFITLDEVTKTLWQESVSESEEIDSYYADSGEGIGSSDMNAFISNMLNASGIKVVVKDNKYVRKD